MAKKAFVNTIIFTLIIINLIIWPAIFMDLNEDSGEASVDQETSEQSVKSETETADTGAEDSSVKGVENTDSPQDTPSEKKAFKILKIE
ncbi:hypothetical protein KHA94_08060 [Bacillus sp. FJAT-49705]|uniref:Uncharacterized protein n=1 Tax=Cytobacillus citreus TaxID=2833586 RepID=A0ABS5NQS3_9BACI|nr:hypothetical protein [Cytobacillus citreus]MBS4190157.1 hypothetical protein [Cytobacillus citreus]